MYRNLITAIQKINHPVHQGKPNPSHGKFFFVGSIPATCFDVAKGRSKIYDTEQDAIDAAVAAGVVRIQKTDFSIVEF